MSTRHRSEVPKPAPSERRVQHHRERQAMRHALTVSEFEDLVDPRIRRTLHVEHGRVELEVGAPHRFRHWKARSWKRRNAVRHERNGALAALAASDDGELEEPLILAAQRMPLTSSVGTRSAMA